MPDVFTPGMKVTRLHGGDQQWIVKAVDGDVAWLKHPDVDFHATVPIVNCILAPEPKPKWEVGKRYRPNPTNQPTVEGLYVRVQVVAVDDGYAFYRRTDTPGGNMHGVRSASDRRYWLEVPVVDFD